MASKAAALIASCLAAISLPIVAKAEPHDSSVQQEVLRVPFAPPIGQQLNYEIDLIRTGDGKSTTTRLFQSLCFEKTESGYLLTISTSRMANENTSIDLTTPSGANRIPIEFRPLLMPMTLEITAEGGISRVRDWPTLQRAITGMPAAFAAAEAPAKRATATEFARRALAPYSSMTAEQAPDAILKGWPSLFGLGGVELVSGQTYETQVFSQPPMLPVTIPATQAVRLTRIDDGLLHLELRSQPDEEKMGLAISQYMDRLGVNMSAAQKANLAQAGQKFRAMKTRDSSEIDLDGQSGIVHRARIERWMSIPGMGEGTDIIAVTRTD
jgi:hypothetical protein